MDPDGRKGVIEWIKTAVKNTGVFIGNLFRDEFSKKKYTKFDSKGSGVGGGGGIAYSLDKVGQTVGQISEVVVRAANSAEHAFEKPFNNTLYEKAAIIAEEAFSTRKGQAPIGAQILSSIFPPSAIVKSSTSIITQEDIDTGEEATILDNASNVTDLIPGVKAAKLAVTTASSLIWIIIKHGNEAMKIARKVPDGFIMTNIKSHGQKVFKKGNVYISPDVDVHKGGAWKVGVIENGKFKRLYTADQDLIKIAD